MMNKKSILFPLLALAFTASAQTETDPVLMVINGKSIHQSEFEYSYHKNGGAQSQNKSLSMEEYVPMFVNYKLKVAAAEAAGLDTVSSFRNEFLLYRDAQLTPYLIDHAFIDSVAYDSYQRTAEYLNGKDLYESAHILIRVSQNDSESVRKAAEAKADSIYKVLQNGGDFEDLARKYSADFGSAKKGGRLSLAGPGTFVKEFEDAAYTLQNGEIARPVLSMFGYHIIKMLNRKHFGTYEEMKPEIVASLKKQGIEVYSSEMRIEKLIQNSKGKLTRREVLDSVMNAQLQHNTELRCLIQEYYDGLLLYDVCKQQVWDVAAQDTVGLEKYFKRNKKDFAWERPHFKGFLYYCKNKKQQKAVKKILKKYGDTKAWRLKVRDAFNADSVTVSVSGPYLCVEGENPFVDTYVFGVKNNIQLPKGYSYAGICGEKMKQPKDYRDVRSQVIEAYKKYKEEQWVESLHRKFSYTIYKDVLNTLK